VEEAQGEGWSCLVRAWFKIEAICRPFKLLGGILLLLVASITWVSMLLTSVDKAKNSICKILCGYILGHVTFFNPVNWALVQSANIFPLTMLFSPCLCFFSSAVLLPGLLQWESDSCGSESFKSDRGTRLPRLYS
jgi:LMBR1 domain-containing protein 1